MTGWALDLTPHLNAVVATFNAERPLGALNAWGNSFPAEEIPFGSSLTVGGTRFALPAKEPGRPDSVESLGQRLEVAGAPEAVGVALLCCGEMGEQRIPVRVLGGEGSVIASFDAVAPGVMIPAAQNPGEAGFACSHLHYPGDYDLALALPVAWRFEARWEAPAAVSRIELGTNPLFHLLALTLLESGAP